MRHVALTVNGARHELELEPRELLVYVLRERLGLTGTNVGCDTSSCGACTVLVDGDSAKSCTVLGVQADGAEITTIEGLAHERRAASRAAGIPRSSRAPVRLLHAGHGDGGRLADRARRGVERGGDPRRPRGEPLPLHRVPQHRRGRSRPPRREGVMSATEERRRTSARRSSGGRTARCSPGRARSSTTWRLPGRSRWSSSAARTRSARVTGDRRSTRRRKAEGVVAVFTAADLQDDWKAAMPCAWPVTEDMKNPPHYPLTETPRYQGDGVAVVIAETRAQAKDAAELVEVDYEPLTRSSTSRRRSRTARRSSTPSSARTSATSGGSTQMRPDRRSTDADVVVTRRYVQPRLIPNAIEPRGVLAVPGRSARSRSTPRHRFRTSCACSSQRRSACPRRSSACRARRRRRLRLEARRLRGGAARGRARAPARPAR